MSQNNKKIIIATGGTGGHIFPSLSLADFLKEEYDIEITTDRRGLKYLKNLDNINIKIINSNTIFNKNILKIFTAVVNIIFSTIYSFAKQTGKDEYPPIPMTILGFSLIIMAKE